MLLQTESRKLLEANQEGWLPLHETAYYGHVDCLKVLLRGKESFTVLSRTVLGFLYGCPSVTVFHCVMLLAEPQTINKRTLKNQTPLILAVSRRQSDCVSYLLEKGADPNLANNQWETPLYKGKYILI